MDCPGCGFQRSVLALMQGDLRQSFLLYPAGIPLLIFFAYGIADRFVNLDTRTELIKKAGFMIVGSMIMISYGVKLYGIYSGHAISI